MAVAQLAPPVYASEYGSGPRPAWRGIAWSEHLRWLQIEGRWVNVLDVGEGPPLVFLHGHSACWQHWLEQLPRFMATNRVVALDLPGFGFSQMPVERVSMQGYARAVDGVCAQLGVDAACVVGNSMGGLVAAELAISYPQRVERLVLAAAAGLAERYLGLPAELIRHPSGRAAGRVMFAMGGVPDQRARWLASRPRGRQAALGFVCTHPPLLHPGIVYEVIRGAGRPAAAPAAVALASYDFRARVHEIAAPTLIVWGDTDRIVSLPSSGEYERLIPRARRTIYADTGHLPMVERPARFSSDLHAFLGE